VEKPDHSHYRHCVVCNSAYISLGRFSFSSLLHLVKRIMQHMCTTIHRDGVDFKSTKSIVDFSSFSSIKVIRNIIKHSISRSRSDSILSGAKLESLLLVIQARNLFVIGFISENNRSLLQFVHIRKLLPSCGAPFLWGPCSAEHAEHA